ncbi:TPM domain-containing protein [Phenylobacterium soli]|uniref:TPM domain-containing protein n=1 Tax=Phenylobacterium soli TaxID=2170551 RepID=A0A328AML7_9CAUL|nr:TPM domain-containing protein [Phenylobacterium soli]RAK54138.1 TPM domain-containing protein [Phenylobacterium soli]
MLLSPEDHLRIERAIAAAEATTRGEIVCAVTEEAATYAEVPLAWAAIVALVLPLLPLAALGALRHAGLPAPGWARPLIGVHLDVVTAVTGFVFVQCTLFIAAFAIASIPAIRRVLTPRAIKQAQVRARALEQFVARGLGRTAERAGVLIFASLKDRQVEILADTGIDARADVGAWTEVVSDLTAGVRAGRPADGFIAAIERAGRLLSRHFPARGDNPNELPDGLVELPAS